MPSASILIKPVSANCNVDCSYCFYKCLSSNREEYNKGFMTEEMLEQLVVQAVDYAEGYLAFAFQGGEPTLAGLDFFRRVVALQKKYHKENLIIENTIQTNGLLLDEEWAEFLKENHFLVGLSLDGPKKIHDRYRLDTYGNGTFERVMKSVDLLGKYKIPFNILSVVAQESTDKASYLYKFYKRNHFEYVQLIPCMDEQERGSALVAESYGKFLCEIFDLWYEDFIKGDRMDIRMFSNLAQMAAGYPAEQCGMNGCCSCYFVVEGDGSVYPCDFYCMDDWKLGTVPDGFTALAQSGRAESFVKDSDYVLPQCQECPFLSLCRGGCRRWREPFFQGKPGENLLCEGYRLFFEHTWERLHLLGKAIKYHTGISNITD